MHVEWHTTELRPKFGMVRTIESHSITLDDNCAHFREGDLVKIAESGAAGIIHNISQGEDGWRAQFSTGIYRHVQYIDRIYLDHDCRKNDCEWVDDDDGEGPWLSHSYVNDYEMIPLPYYDVRFTKAGDVAINVGPVYRGSSALRPTTPSE